MGTIDDPGHAGYFPQGVLTEVKRPPHRRGAGEACSVAERFEAPSGVSGYITVVPGEVVKIIHPMKDPCVWACVERTTRSGLETGWVPEAVLSDGCADVVNHDRVPHPAG